MQLTAKNIAKLLPFDKTFKDDLLQRIDSLDPDQKFTIERMLWETYDAMFLLKLEENLAAALLRAKNRQESLDKELYKRVREQTEKEMQSEALEKTETADLEAARKAMEVIVKEIHAAKSSKKQ